MISTINPSVEKDPKRRQAKFCLVLVHCKDNATRLLGLVSLSLCCCSINQGTRSFSVTFSHTCVVKPHRWSMFQQHNLRKKIPIQTMILLTRSVFFFCCPRSQQPRPPLGKGCSNFCRKSNPTPKTIPN